MLTIDELIKGVNDLVPLPKAYLRVQELVNDPYSSLDDVTKVIANDAALTSRILRVANSAYMALASKVDTVARAVQVLGLNQVHDLALAGAAVGSLTKIKTPTLDISDFWRRSVYCAVVARIISKQRKLGSAERLFVSGLLHDTGHLLLAYRQPERYAEIRAHSIESGIPMAAIEQQELGFTYADLGAALLSSWQLPPTIIMPVQYHVLEVAEMPSAEMAETTILQISAVIARAAMWRSEADEPVPDFDPLALQQNGIDDSLIETIMHEADEAVIEAMTLLLPNVSPKRTTRAAAVTAA
jgi:HD-like signal output (HDOD) protein